MNKREMGCEDVDLLRTRPSGGGGDDGGLLRPR
jgi:hypothetical protein